MLINRKAFLQQIVLAGAASITIPVIPAFLYGASDYDQITILHTNDVHSQLFPKYRIHLRRQRSKNEQSNSGFLPDYQQ